MLSRMPYGHVAITITRPYIIHGHIDHIDYTSKVDIKLRGHMAA